MFKPAIIEVKDDESCQSDGESNSKNDKKKSRVIPFLTEMPE